MMLCFLLHFLLRGILGRERRDELTCCPQLICMSQGGALFNGLFLVPLLKENQVSLKGIL